MEKRREKKKKSKQNKPLIKAIAAFPVNSIDKLFKCSILYGSSIYVEDS